MAAQEGERMETVEVVIKIPKQDFDFIKDEFADGDMPDEKDLKETTYYAIANGTVLPKGHGRLIDADKYKFDNEDGFCIGFGNDAMNVFKRSVDETPTVIEADKEVDG